ncbi:unnamed protein product [Penicillium camemberti]|uniref:Str. FM013 n=1 Tax=Penicillium camemberti (strain FM 013) TaxID=1429867 RepID=A0A0G4PM14_PENC3|nr:unnamed protein product [Penicillium camemberti]
MLWSQWDAPKTSTCVIGARREVPASAITCGSADLRPGSCATGTRREALESYRRSPFWPLSV